MNVTYCSNKLGQMMEGEKVSKIEIERNNIYLNLAIYKNDGKIIKTSPISFALQSAVNTILFITETGSRYAIEFEDDVFPASLKREIRNISVINNLRFTEIGKKILQS